MQHLVLVYFKADIHLRQLLAQSAGFRIGALDDKAEFGIFKSTARKQSSHSATVGVRQTTKCSDCGLSDREMPGLTFDYQSTAAGFIKAQCQLSQGQYSLDGANTCV